MKTTEIKQLLKHYFDGETTVKQERELEAYFKSDEIAEELKKYHGFFNGLSELTESVIDNSIESDVMDFIQKNAPDKNSRRMPLWSTLSGIAASVILVIGGSLLFQQKEQQYNDSFDNPEVAYAYAEQTLAYVSSKYNQGFAALANFEKIKSASEPLQEGIKPVNKYLDMIENMNTRKIN